MATAQPKPLTRAFLLQRGYCCGNICKNCPYETEDGEKHVAGATKISKKEKK